MLCQITYHSQADRTEGRSASPPLLKGRYRRCTEDIANRALKCLAVAERGKRGEMTSWLRSAREGKSPANRKKLRPQLSPEARAALDVRRTKNIIPRELGSGELTGATTPDGVKACAAEASRTIAAEQRIVHKMCTRDAVVMVGRLGRRRRRDGDTHVTFILTLTAPRLASPASLPPRRSGRAASCFATRNDRARGAPLSMLLFEDKFLTNALLPCFTTYYRTAAGEDHGRVVDHSNEGASAVDGVYLLAVNSIVCVLHSSWQGTCIQDVTGGICDTSRRRVPIGNGRSARRGLGRPHGDILTNGWETSACSRPSRPTINARLGRCPYVSRNTDKRRPFIPRRGNRFTKSCNDCASRGRLRRRQP